MTCATTQRCAGVGYYESDALPQAPLLSNLGATGWTPTAGPAPSDLGPNIRPLASAMDGTVAIAVGYYIGTRQGRKGLQEAIDSAQAIMASPETRKFLSEAINTFGW